MSRSTLMWCLWAAVMAGVCVWSLVPSSARERLRPVRPRTWGDALPQWLRPRPDAWPARQRWLIGSGVGVGVVIWAWGKGPVIVPIAVLVAAITAVALGRLERDQSRTSQARLRQQAPSGLDAIAACLEAGLPLRRATEVVAALSPPELAAQLRTVVNGIKVGLTDAQAWQGIASGPVLGAVARDVARAADWGLAVSSILTEAAADLRRQGEADAKTRARAVGVRTVLPLSLCYLPAFVLLGIVPVLASGVLSVFGH